jgi:hypothetical protein
VIGDDFLQTLQYRQTALPAEILADLKQFAAIRARYEQKRNKWLTALVICVILMILGVVGIIIAANATAKPGAGNGNPWLGVMILATVAAVMAVVVCAVQMMKAGRLILDRRRFQLAAEVVRHLACDMGRTAPVQLTLDYNRYHQPGYRTSAGQVGSSQVSSYELPWLSLGATLLDGNSLQIETRMFVKRKERAKRKYTKVKEMLWEGVTLTLKVKGSNSEGMERLPEFLRTPRLPPGAVMKKAKVEGTRLTLEVETQRQQRLKDRSSTTNADADQHLADGHVILMMCLAAYHALGECRGAGQGA